MPETRRTPYTAPIIAGGTGLAGAAMIINALTIVGLGRAVLGIGIALLLIAVISTAALILAENSRKQTDALAESERRILARIAQSEERAAARLDAIEKQFGALVDVADRHATELARVVDLLGDELRGRRINGHTVGHG
jgi:hypothetical protein